MLLSDAIIKLCRHAIGLCYYCKHSCKLGQCMENYAAAAAAALASAVRDRDLSPTRTEVKSTVVVATVAPPVHQLEVGCPRGCNSWTSPGAM